jgi:hypothetical protein
VETKKMTCPRCSGHLKRLTKLIKDPEETIVLYCKACDRLAAHVEGIQDLWRDAAMPNAVEWLKRDLEDGLRQRHLLTSDASDAMWTSF